MTRSRTRYLLVGLLALFGSASANAEESSKTSASWRLPGLDTGLTGGLHTIYAERSGDGIADVQVGLSVMSDKELLGSTGARRIGFRVGGVFPVLDMLEFGIDIAGSSVSGLGGLNEEINSFGDIRLRGKYYYRHKALGIAGIAGYDLLQGVQDQSRVADVASPLLGFGLSYFGRDCKASNAVRLHLNTLYVYDRTINFLDGQRVPQDFERFAWQMRDYTHLDVAFGFEYALTALLPMLEYKAELPLDTPNGNFEPIHTVSPGLKFNPIDALVVTVGLDFGFGGDANAAPAVPLVDGEIGVVYRFKGDIQRPAAIVKAAPIATDSEPMPDPAPTTATSPAEPVTEPAEAPSAATSETMPEDDAQEAPAEIPDETPEPEEEDSVEAAPEAAEPPDPAAEPTPPAPKQSDSQDNQDGPVDLDQFAE